jgi:hypothetical protein
MPANIFQQLTDNNQTALITIPVLVRNPSDNGGKGGEGDFDSIVRGSNNAFYDTVMEWMDRQGQGHARIRLGHEAELRKTFPWGIGWCPDAQTTRDFSPFKEGMTAAFKYFRKHMPRATLVWCHFFEGYLRPAPDQKIYIHADEYDLDPRLYDIEALDWYDGKGKVINASTWQGIYDATRDIPGKGRTPSGLNAWERRIKARGKPFAVDEWGIVCEGPSQPERDNPFFIELMHKHNKERNWAHSCYFNPHDRDGPHRIKDGTLAGTRKATDKYIELHRGQ